MATFLDDELEKQDQEDSNMNLSGPVSFSGGGGGGKATSSAGSNNTPSRFVSFDRYYNANAGGAESMANRALSDVQGKIDTANTGLQNEQNQFNQDVARGIGQPSVQSDVGNTYRAHLGRYSGPTEFAPSQTTRDNLTNAYSSLQALRTPEGLQTAIGRSGTSGGDRFNSFLTGQAGASRVQDMWNRYQGMGNAVQDSMNRGAESVRHAEDSQNRINEAAQLSANNQTTALQNEVAEAERVGNIADETVNRENKGKRRRRNILTD